MGKGKQAAPAPAADVIINYFTFNVLEKNKFNLYKIIAHKFI